MTRLFSSRIKSFSHAFSGLWYVIQTQTNARIHLVATILVICLAWGFNLSKVEWILLVFAIGIVWVAETINTAFESIVDLVSPQRHPLAKIGKDVSAAAVLIAAFVSAVIGLIILGPPFAHFIQSLF